MEKFKDVVVISGKYKGLSGIADYSKSNKTGKVIFYPIIRTSYRVILSINDVKEV